MMNVIDCVLQVTLIGNVEFLLCVVSISIINSSAFTQDCSTLLKGIRNKNPNLFSSYTFVCDSIAQVERPIFEYLQSETKDKSLAIVKKFLDKGEVKMISCTAIKASDSDWLRTIAMKEFVDLTPLLPSFNDCEKNAALKYDTLIARLTRAVIAGDSMQIKMLRKQEQKILKWKCYASYRGKVQKSKKYIMILYHLFITKKDFSSYQLLSLFHRLKTVILCS